MTKQEYQDALNNILSSMVGEQVIHNRFGMGKILGFLNNLCIIKYDEFPESKLMAKDDFFSYNEPVNGEIIDRIDTLKCEYEMSDDTVNFSNNDTANKTTVKQGKITFDDVIGLDNVKEAINQMVVYPYKYKEIYKAFKRDSGGGLLLYGPPGVGKTMIAKAIANEIDAKFFSVKCSDIASKWYGESEKKLKNIFDESRKHKRSIIFFDEFDSLGVNRDDNNSHGAHMVVSELLSQMDGFEDKNNTTLIIASTNKPWNLDSALLRSGRFNKKIFIGLPNEFSRNNLLKHILKDLPLNDINYDEISKMTEGYSNADVVEVCNVAKDLAIKRSISLHNVSPISQEDLLQAVNEVKSTIVKKELDKLYKYRI